MFVLRLQQCSPGVLHVTGPFHLLSAAFCSSPRVALQLQGASGDSERSDVGFCHCPCLSRCIHLARPLSPPGSSPLAQALECVEKDTLV